MKKFALFASIFLIGLAACKKEENPPTQKTTKEKIVAKWMGDKIEITIVAPPPIGTQTQTEDIGYLNVEFKADNTAVADSAGFDPETTNWSLIGDDKIILDSDTFDIMVLTDSQFHFGISETDSIGGVPVNISNTIKLKK